jgi:HSP20 family protein
LAIILIIHLQTKKLKTMMYTNFKTRNMAPFAGLVNELFNGWEKVDTYTPAINITEDETHYYLHLAVPGIPKEDLKINVEANKLTVSYTTPTEDAPNQTKFIRKEFGNASFTRTVKLSNRIDSSAIEASHTNGVLVISLAKKETEQSDAKVISIQ